MSERTLRDMQPHKFWRNPSVTGFVEKIAANPEDDLPRLVFADWLQDTAGGDVDEQHAAFIRDSLASPDPVPVPANLRARVYAGFNLNDVRVYAVPLSEGIVYARPDRGFLSRCQFEPSVGGLFSLHNWFELIERREQPRDLFTAGIVGTGFGMPIGRVHPFWFELDSPEHLGLRTFAGRGLPGGKLAVDYLGERRVFLHSEIAPMGRAKGGEYVIRETLARHWEERLRRIGFPARVRVADKLVAEINASITVVA
jgi:uncharacterized protein (TIGR02996 family)